MTASLRTRGFALAGAILVVDQITKLWILHAADLPMRLAPFAEFILVWNRGISYGLFQQEGTGRWLLVGITALASVALAVWLFRAKRAFVAFSVALILGGAVGNLIDRVAYGAVVDFVHLFVGRWSWYVFNVADAAIVIGVVLLLIESFIKPGKQG